MQYTKRTSIGRCQFIFDAGFDSTDFGLGLTASYLDPWEMEEMQMMGFWCIRVELLFIELTLNITDRTFRRDKIRYHSSENDLIRP